MSSYKLPLFFAKLSLVIISALGSEVAIEKYRKQCSGQVKLATDLYSSQYLCSDSFGVNPPL